MSIINLCNHSDIGLDSEAGSTWVGVAISSAIATAWLISLICSLSWDLTNSTPATLVCGLLLRTFLHTGLFVIAHDAMHGNILPSHPINNRWIGQLALATYGFLPYPSCRRLHWQHHSYPTQSQDPDFYPHTSGSLPEYFIRWYCHFMGHYLTPHNLRVVTAGIGVTTVSLLFLFQVSIQNLVFFWLLPWVLSSIQLFTFGIFLPHYGDGNNHGPHQPRSHYYPIICSLLACYHFSYHWEHHTYPDTPWYQLPNRTP